MNYKQLVKKKKKIKCIQIKKNVHRHDEVQSVITE